MTLLNTLLKSAAGTKRNLVVALKTSALLVDKGVALTSDQVLPSTEYCHLPWPAVLASPVITRPARLEPASASENLAPMMVAMSEPGLVPVVAPPLLSSANVMLLSAVSVGASLVLVTVTVKVSVLLYKGKPDP